MCIVCAHTRQTLAIVHLPFLCADNEIQSNYHRGRRLLDVCINVRVAQSRVACRMPALETKALIVKVVRLKKLTAHVMSERGILP